MTIKEAIEILKDLRIYDDDCETDVEALTIAIDTFEKLEEGKLIELPCKVGDTVYDITLAGLTKKKADKIEIFSITMLNTAKRLHFCFHCHNSKKATISFELQDIGKIIFLTKEEAEKKLEELKNNG